jgi:predicted nucleic acid-binding protein
MKYLLDVNTLTAFGLTQHQFHQRVVDWIRSQRGSIFMTVSVTEIGFVRVVAGVPMYGLDVSQAKGLLHGMKTNTAQPLTFLPDANDITALPGWVKSPGQVTDGHLAQLAKSNGALLATLDKGIPGAFLIPQISD